MMLQRAASHVRTRQSKWLEHNLKDTEEKVHYVLKLLEEEGDSFAKRAEMYYKRRPELISFVEEFFRAYHALAERYDHVSTELQNANTPHASVFPDQVPWLALEDNDDDGDTDTTSPKFNNKPTNISKSNILFVLRSSKKDFKGMILTVKKKLKPKKPVKGNSDKAVEEIGRLQKEILGLETGTESVKSSYESGLAKYLEIVNCIKENQEKICSLQKEVNKDVMIEDREAQISKAVTALKACQETLAELQEKQERTVEEMKVERNKIRQPMERLMFLTDQKLGKQGKSGNSTVQDKSVRSDEKFEIGVLVNNAISLEAAVSSRTALIERLRGENDNLQEQIQTLEEKERQKKMNRKNTLANNVREMEESLISVKDQDQINNLHMQITKTCCYLYHLSAKQPRPETNERLDDAVNAASLPEKEEHNPIAGLKDQEHNLDHQEVLEKKLNGIESEDQDKEQNLDNQDGLGKKFNKTELEDQDQEQNLDNQDNLKKKFYGIKSEDQVAIAVQQDAENRGQSSVPNATEYNLENRGMIQEKDKSHCKVPESILEVSAHREDVLLMKQLLLNKMEDREKMLLKEYTTILRNLKEMKKTLNESEKKRKTDNNMKDDEIQSLQQKLSLLQENGDLIEPKLLENREQDGYEEQIRTKVDELLEENLDFCFRFSTYFSQIQKFNASIHDLHIEISKLKDISKQDGRYKTRFALRSEVCPINKRLREIQMDLTVWSDKGALVKEELKSRYLSLSSVEDELRNTLNKSGKDFDSTITTYRATKFQGEISNMKRENRMIAYKLRSGLDHINALQIEIEKFLVKLSKEFPHSRSKNLQQSANKPLVPLKSFICEAKPKKQSLSSFFSCIHPSCIRISNQVHIAPSHSP